MLGLYGEEKLSNPNLKTVNKTKPQLMKERPRENLEPGNQQARPSFSSSDSPSFPSSLSPFPPPSSSPCFSWSDYGDQSRCDSRFLAPPSDVDGNVDLNVTSVALDEFVAWGHKDSNASIVREGGCIATIALCIMS